MARVLLIGYAPQAVDFSDPALPPGMTAEKIAAGIEVAMKLMRQRGWDADFLAVQPDDTAASVVSDRLSSQSCECVVIGGGVRLASGGLIIFEAIINAIRKSAPNAAIAFNTNPENSAEAAARWI